MPPPAPAAAAAAAAEVAAPAPAPPPYYLLKRWHRVGRAAGCGVCDYVAGARVPPESALEVCGQVFLHPKYRDGQRRTVVVKRVVIGPDPDAQSVHMLPHDGAFHPTTNPVRAHVAAALDAGDISRFNTYTGSVYTLSEHAPAAPAPVPPPPQRPLKRPAVSYTHLTLPTKA